MLKRTALLCLCTFLAACSSTTFFYNRLDFLLPWYLERYVDLDRAQSARLDAALVPLLEWHRTLELPHYVDLLQSMEDELDRPLSMQTVDLYTRRLEVAWYRLRDRMLNELLRVGQDLSNEQVDEFTESLENKQRKYERKYLTRDDEEYREDAYDKLCESVEDYLGRLNGAQRDRLHEAAQSIVRSDDIWLRERAAWIAALTHQLQREPGWQERVRRTVGEWESELDAETAAVYDHNTLTVQNAVVDVLNMRDERQDKRLRGKLRDLREDLTSLSTPVVSARS